MKQKELKRLRRTELLDLMLQMQQEIDRLREENQALSEKLRDRQITLEQAGNIAEASLKLNKVFEAAQQAAEDYLNSVRAGNVQALRAEDAADAGSD